MRQEWAWSMVNQSIVLCVLRCSRNGRQYSNQQCCLSPTMKIAVRTSSLSFHKGLPKLLQETLIFWPLSIREVLVSGSAAGRVLLYVNFSPIIFQSK